MQYVPGAGWHRHCRISTPATSTAPGGGTGSRVSGSTRSASIEMKAGSA